MNEGEGDVKQLVDKLRSKDTHERFRAREQIVASGGSAVEFLLELLDEQEEPEMVVPTAAEAVLVKLRSAT